MKFKETKIKGLWILDPEVKSDERGYFFRVFCEKEISDIRADFHIRQINRSKNLKKGTIRGLHFQKEPCAEDKIISCIKGSVFDVAVDLRPNSETFGQWESAELTEENKKMFLVPKGFAHGYQTLEDNSEVLYFTSAFYSPEYEGGARWNDPFFNIQWPITEDLILSEKDKNWPFIPHP